MWPKKDLLYSAEYTVPNRSDRHWEVFVAKDDDSTSPLVWLFVSVEYGKIRNNLYLSEYCKRMPESEETYLKAAKELATLVEKLFGKHRPRKMLPAINKVILKHLGRESGVVFDNCIHNVRYR